MQHEQPTKGAAWPGVISIDIDQAIRVKLPAARSCDRRRCVLVSMDLKHLQDRADALTRPRLADLAMCSKRFERKSVDGAQCHRWMSSSGTGASPSSHRSISMKALPSRLILHSVRAAMGRNTAPTKTTKGLVATRSARSERGVGTGVLSIQVDVVVKVGRCCFPEIC